MKFSSRSLRSVVFTLSTIACGVDGGGSTDEPVSTGSSTGDDSTSTTTGVTPTTGEDGSSGASTGAGTSGSGTGGGTEGTTGKSETTGGGDTGFGDESLCEETPTTITCPKMTIELGPWQRDVHYQLPSGGPLPGGWPVVLMFQVRAVLRVLGGFDGGWPASNRADGKLSLSQAWSNSWWIACFGAAGLACVLLAGPELAAWSLPVALPMILAPLLIWLTSLPLPPGFVLWSTPAIASPVLEEWRAIYARWAGDHPDIGAEFVPPEAANVLG